MVEDRLVDRGRTREHGDPLALDAGEDPVDVEDRLGQHLGAAGDAGQDPCLQPEHVEVGVDHEVPVVRTQPGHVHPVGGDTQRPAVGHDDTLRQPGRPRGEEDVRGVVGPQPLAPPVDLGTPLIGGSPEERGPGLGPVGWPPARHHDRLEVRELDVTGAQQGDVVGVEEVRDGDQHPGTAPGQDVRRLAALEAGVDGDQDGAGLEQAQRGHDPFGTVEGPDRHAVAGLDAGGHQGGAERPGRLEELGIAEAGRAILHGRALPEPAGGRREERRDGRRRAIPAPGHRAATSETFIRCARLPPMILRMDSSSRPSSSSTST